MAVLALSIALTGSGTIGNVLPGWSVSEEASPVDPADSNGSVGSATLTARAASDSAFIGKNDVTLTHPQLGSWVGRVDAPTITGQQVTASVNGLAGILNATVTAPPQFDFVYASSVFGARGNGGNGLFISPSGIAFDAAGGMYVTDSSALSVPVQKFTSAGVWVSQFGSAGTGDGQFTNASGIAVDGSGNIFVADYTANRIQKFSPAGAFITKWGSAGAGNGQFTGPSWIAVDGSGNVYITDSGNNRVQKFTNAGVFVRAWGTGGSGPGQFSYPNGIAIDKAGSVYVGDYNNARVQKFTNTGTYLGSWGSQGTGNGQFNIGPNGIAVDANGDVLVIDSSPFNFFQADRVQKFSAYGNYITQWGSDGAAVGQYGGAQGIATDSAGRFAVVELNNDRVQVSTPTGTNAGVPLSAVFQRYVDLAVVNHPVNYTASSNPLVSFPAWQDKCWAKLKELAAAYGVEFVAVGSVLTVRNVAARTLDITNRTPPSLSIGQGTGQQVNIIAQNPTPTVGGEFFNAKTAGNTIYTVDVLAQVSITLQTAHSPSTIAALTPTDTTGVAVGRYYVQDSTGAPVAAADWLYYGGQVSAKVGPGLGQIVLTLVGPRSFIPGKVGPFSLASGTGTSRQAELSIAGTGVLTSPVTVPLLTGADPAVVTQDVASTINSPFIGTVKQAYTRGAWAADLAAGPIMTLSWSMAAQDLAGFGLDVGSIVKYGSSKYRVTNVAYGNLTATLTAKRHVTISDVFDAAQWLFSDEFAADAGLTFTQVFALYAGLTFSQVFALHPTTTNDQMKAIWAGYSNSDTKIQPLKGF